MLSRSATRSVMGSDGMAFSKPDFKGFSLTVTAKDEGEADKTFAALSNGGNVTMPLTKTFFSPNCGMLTDKFGIGWMVIVAQRSRRVPNRNEWMETMTATATATRAPTS